MMDRETLVKSLACHANGNKCDECPIYGEECSKVLCEAALEYLEKGASAEEMLEEYGQKCDFLSSENKKLIETALTRSEAYSLAEFIDMNLIDIIRADTDIDSVKWLINIVEVFKKVCKISGYESLTAGDVNAD